MPPKKEQMPAYDSNGTYMPISVTAPNLQDKQWSRVSPNVPQVPGSLKEGKEDKRDSDGPPAGSGLERPRWGHQIEFLMSCIATSIGLGNVWRFAFIAYENGGGAFLVPYIILLLLIGKPMYYLECVIGQFGSRNTIKVWALSPGMRGTGYAQFICTFYVASYYVTIIALCLYYLVISFQSTLPWTWCRPEWEENCLPSDPALQNGTVAENASSSAELYFINTVLRRSVGLDGLGTPIWYLTLCLLACWVVVFLVVAKGVKSSGKVAYFLAGFPYVVMITLLITTCATLPGAGNGIVFFITPQWEKITELKVWYAATTQVFFSLTVGIGPIIMFSSYNDFKVNVYRDSMIITTLDTFTSLISGFTIFGILGNLAHELNANVGDVIGSGGSGLAFITYPDALSKTYLPHVLALLFFLMMTVLGIGSAVAFLSTINTVLLDAFPTVHTTYISGLSCTVGFFSGLVYVTPEGQYILTLVDHFGGTFLALFGCIAEVIGVSWIYGLENFCLDLEFMLGLKASKYWRFCWGLITPLLMLSVFCYALVDSDLLLYGGYYRYPNLAYICGYLLLFFGISFLPICLLITFHKKKTGNYWDTFKLTFRPSANWGPRLPQDHKRWVAFKDNALAHQQKFRASKLRHLC